MKDKVFSPIGINIRNQIYEIKHATVKICIPAQSCAFSIRRQCIHIPRIMISRLPRSPLFVFLFMYHKLFIGNFQLQLLNITETVLFPVNYQTRLSLLSLSSPSISRWLHSLSTFNSPVIIYHLYIFLQNAVSTALHSLCHELYKLIQLSAIIPLFPLLFYILRNFWHSNLRLPLFTLFIHTNTVKDNHN